MMTKFVPYYKNWKWKKLIWNFWSLWSPINFAKINSILVCFVCGFFGLRSKFTVTRLRMCRARRLPPTRILSLQLLKNPHMCSKVWHLRIGRQFGAPESVMNACKVNGRRIQLGSELKIGHIARRSITLRDTPGSGECTRLQCRNVWSTTCGIICRRLLTELEKAPRNINWIWKATCR